MDVQCIQGQGHVQGHVPYKVNVQHQGLKADLFSRSNSGVWSHDFSSLTLCFVCVCVCVCVCVIFLHIVYTDIWLELAGIGWVLLEHAWNWPQLRQQKQEHAWLGLVKSMMFQPCSSNSQVAPAAKPGTYPPMFQQCPESGFGKIHNVPAMPRWHQTWNASGTRSRLWHVPAIPRIWVW